MTTTCSICHPPTLAELIQSEPAITRLWQALPRRQFAPRAVMQSAGETSTRSWLIERGLVRFYYLCAQGTERNRSFHVEGSWIGGGLPPLASPSPYTIETLEATDTVELSYATLITWQQQFPAIGPLLGEAMNYLFTTQSQREAQLLTLPPLERYQAFLADQSALVDRIPIHHVASYLGISNVSLSRIRARLGMAHQGR
ncbi:MAG: Crp/Fnr family transcriptional regulator [Rhodoferax sp.]|nr:Crp/Fnr family transcriptional regulator [Rhodoferax sp.]MBP9685983.1 Crp/Fnr family transcriptional regulator [Rhodoferax sp.]